LSFQICKTKEVTFAKSMQRQALNIYPAE